MMIYNVYRNQSIYINHEETVVFLYNILSCYLQKQSKKHEILPKNMGFSSSSLLWVTNLLNGFLERIQQREKEWF